MQPPLGMKALMLLGWFALATSAQMVYPPPLTSNGNSSDPRSYYVRASSVRAQASLAPWCAFDRVAPTSSKYNSTWQTADQAFPANRTTLWTETGLASPNGTNLTADGYFGPWIMFHLPVSAIASSYSLAGNMRKWRVYARNLFTGGWDRIHEGELPQWPTYRFEAAQFNKTSTFALPLSVRSNEYALVVNAIHAGYTEFGRLMLQWFSVEGPYSPPRPPPSGNRG